MTRKSDPSLLRTPDGNLVGPEELQEIMAEQGYSAGDRDQFLKGLLTELEQADAKGTKDERQTRLAEEIRAIQLNEEEKLDERTARKPPTPDE